MWLHPRIGDLDNVISNNFTPISKEHKHTMLSLWAFLWEKKVHNAKQVM